MKPTFTKIKLGRDLVVSTSTYEHEYMPFKRDAENAVTKEFLNWKFFLQKYITFRIFATATKN